MAININHSVNKIQSTDNTSDLTLEVQGDGHVNVSARRVVDVQDPVDPQDAVTKAYLQNALDNFTGGSSIDLSTIEDLLGRLAPQSPPTLDTETISLVSSNNYRITAFVQTDNTGDALSANAGEMVSNVLRTDDYQLSSVTQVGPGTEGTLEVIRNTVSTASVTFTEENNNGSYTDVDRIVISNNVDYGTITGDATGFHQVYNASVSGTNVVSEGWNKVKLVQGEKETNSITWYSDQSNPGSPEVTNISVTPDANQQIVYSSSVPHFTDSQIFNISFDVNKLSGDFYPSTDRFFDASSSTPTGSGINKLSDLTYTDVGIATPLPRNAYATSTYTITTSTTVRTGTGVSTPNAGPSATIDNSYSTTTVTFPVANAILYMEDNVTTGEPVDETRIIVNNVGFGSGDATRVETVGGDTPVEGTTFTNWNGETTVLNSYDATVVAGVAAHDETDYSTGYFPVGPDLSSGRSGDQYIQFAFNRTATSKFGIEYTGKLSGLWIRLPGSSIDNTSTINGWMDASIPYEGTGVPGADTSQGGNGTNGCGLGSLAPIGSSVSNKHLDITFGTESSSNSVNNTILVRIKLSSGDSVSKLKFVTAS